MNIRRIFPLIVALAAIFLSTSCKKDNAEEAGGTKLSKLVFDAGMDSSYSQLFEYDNAGRLHLTTTIMHGSPYLTTEYFYNGDNIERTTQTIVGLPYTSTQIYQYNNDNIVKKITSNIPGYEYYYSFAYNNQRQMIADTAVSQGTPAYYTSYIYTNENLTEWRDYRKADNSMDWLPDGVTKATYTNSGNPFFAGGVETFFNLNSQFGGIITLSKQLVATIQYPNGYTSLYKYQFYGDGLPKRVEISQANSPNNIQTIDFYYE